MRGRVNPACAGMIRPYPGAGPGQPSKPRVCGDDPAELYGDVLRDM